METIQLARNRGKFGGASFYDISGAFDNVKHSSLFYILKKAVDASAINRGARRWLRGKR